MKHVVRIKVAYRLNQCLPIQNVYRGESAACGMVPRWPFVKVEHIVAGSGEVCHQIAANESGATGNYDSAHRFISVPACKMRASSAHPCESVPLHGT
jgi:hypothetical protein